MSNLGYIVFLSWGSSMALPILFEHCLVLSYTCNVLCMWFLDAEYQMAAQAIDSRTLIGLARSVTADQRLFLPPPKFIRKEVLSLLFCLAFESCSKLYQSSWFYSTCLTLVE